MCSVELGAAAVMAIASAATTTVSIVNSNRAAHATADSANAAALADYAAQDAKAVEANTAAAKAAMDAQREAAVRRGQARVASGEANVLGNSVIREMSNIALKESENLGWIRTNAENQVTQINRETGKITAANRGRIAQVNAEITPDWLAGLQIGIAGTQGAMSGYSMGRSYGAASKELTVPQGRAATPRGRITTT